MRKYFLMQNMLPDSFPFNVYLRQSFQVLIAQVVNVGWRLWIVYLIVMASQFNIVAVYTTSGIVFLVAVVVTSKLYYCSTKITDLQCYSLPHLLVQSRRQNRKAEEDYDEEDGSKSFGVFQGTLPKSAKGFRKFFWFGKPKPTVIISQIWILLHAVFLTNLLMDWKVLQIYGLDSIRITIYSVEVFVFFVGLSVVLSRLTLLTSLDCFVRKDLLKQLQ